MKDKLENKPNHAIALWRALEGRWEGKKRLWLSPEVPEENSPSKATVAISEDGRQVEIGYDWLHDERRQSSVIKALLRGNGKAEARWSDTFHTQGGSMPLKGKVDKNGIVSVRGQYAEEWGWRILLDPTGARSFKVAMYNVDPKDKEELAVEIVYRRIPGAAPQPDAGAAS